MNIFSQLLYPQQSTQWTSNPTIINPLGKRHMMPNIIPVSPLPYQNWNMSHGAVGPGYIMPFVNSNTSPMQPPGTGPVCTQPSPMPTSTAPPFPNWVEGEKRSEPPITTEPQPPPSAPYFIPNTMPSMIQSNVVQYPQISVQAQPPILNLPAPGIPLGLAHLMQVDRLLVHQEIQLLEVLMGCEANNRYQVMDVNGHKIFDAEEDTDCCTRQCLGPVRPFDMKFVDGNHQEVIHLVRPFACGSCCFPCCLQSIEVYSPPGSLIGSVQQNWTLCDPSFEVKDGRGQPVFHIDGPCCTCSCGGDVVFKVLTLDKTTEVGKISKKWSGFLQENFTDADNFGISFPSDLDVQMKATMLGACMLIDFMYFEQTQNNNRTNHVV